MFEAIEKKVVRQFEPETNRVPLHVCSCLVVLALLMPHSGSESGWTLVARLFGVEQQPLGVLPYISVYLTAGFGIFVTMIAVATRRFIGAFIATCGCALSVVFGVVAVWSLQTGADHSGAMTPGIGLFLSTGIMVFMTIRWVSAMSGGRLPRHDLYEVSTPR